MSDVQCFDASALDRVLALPDEHPERRHARACPRCGALLESYRLYQEPGTDADAPHVASADARLDAWLREEIAPVAAPSPRVSTMTPNRRATRVTRWDALLRPGPALALAAAIAVVALVALWPRGDRTMQMRGAPGGATVAVTSVRLDDEGLHLMWSAHPGADAYEAILLAGDGREAARIPLGAGTATTVPRARLPLSTAPADPLFLRIAALSGGEVIATSTVRPLPGP